MGRPALDHELWERVMDRDDWTCRYCGQDAASVDHFIPYSKQPINKIWNLLACCRDCQAVAGAQTFETVDEKRRHVLSRRFGGRRATV